MRKNLIILILVSITFIKGQIISTVAGSGGNGFGGDGGTATNAILSSPFDLAFDQAGNMYISDASNHRIRKVSVSGIISTFAGTSTAGYSGDGGQASLAKLDFPKGLAFDASGNLYVADAGNHCVRKITPSGIISTFAGTGVSASSGDGGQAALAELKEPYDVAVDAIGNVFIADGNDHKIRKVNTSGVISTYAGNGIVGFSGDNGAATSAQLMSPFAIAIDGSGNLYIADYGNHRIRKVSSSGIITTYAGTGTLNSSGDGGPATAATFWGLYGLGTDLSGNLYISDNGVHNMRKIDNTGIITHFAGSGSMGFSGDGGLASQAQIKLPLGIGMDASFNLYFADSQNHRIRKVCLATSCATGIDELTNEQNKLMVYPNPNSGSFNINTEVQNAKLVMINSLGQVVYTQNLTSGTNTISTVLSGGLYSYQIVFDGGEIKTGKVSVH